ncbi:MAG: nucleoside-diphosphate-sugar epimerase [Gammaproteobacteria bacterium]|jgi:nucleoside-diphosphate-sugar epimerase
MKALVVGGTGPTGPYIVNGLQARGYDVTIFHRGAHEIPEIGPDVEHIHGDPHFLETIEDSLNGRTFDVAVVTYGRVRLLAQALAGKVGRFVSVGGVASYRGYLTPDLLFPVGLASPVPESAPVVQVEAEHRFSYLIAQTEQTVLDFDPNATHFRYPYVYGPRQLIPSEWSIIRRIVDQRPSIVVADGGINLTTRGYAENLAYCVLLAVDKPEASAGKIYNCGDEQQFTFKQIVEIISQHMGQEIECINMPYEIALPARPYTTELTTHHRLMDISKIQQELDYRDVRPTVEALGLTVDWLLQNRPEPGGELEQRLQDPFNYAGEDKILTEWQACLERIAQIPFEIATERPHPYAHPKNPGERDHRNR